MAILALEQAVLRVGIDDAAPIPMQTGGSVVGTFRGYEVDLLEQLARRLNCRIEYHRAWWSLITEELTSGKLDLVRSGCSKAIRYRVTTVLLDDSRGSNSTSR